ncbi:MAG: hypothetical protein IPK82_09020 [Polyangiaceae bacterium]|nr:hypothetical protein [Polyangiaceae bacterium]
MKAPSPLLGFNNNVRHKGRVFHIQTEDSGVRHPHIITHLFADGGRILKTIKTSYAEFIDAPNMAEVVRQMMQDQHKSMFMALRDGQFDHLLEELPAKGARPSAPGPAAKIGAEVSLASKTEVAPPPAAAAPPAVATPQQIQTTPTMPAARAPLSIGSQAASNPGAARAPEELPISKAPMAAESVRVATPPSPTFPGAIPPRAPPSVRVATPLTSAPTMPAVPVVVPAPPPAALVDRDSSPPQQEAPPRRKSGPPGRVTPTRMPSARPRLDIDPAAIHRTPDPHAPPAGSTLASVVEATVDDGPSIELDVLERAAAEAETPLFQQIRDLPPPPAAVVTRSSGPPGAYSAVGPPVPPSSRGRYAPSRPSSIFSAVRPQEGSSIFGEDLISEKSLDEVILSYLAEDLEPSGDKK